MAEGRGPEPDRLVQGPRHDRGHLGGRPRGCQGGRLRLHGQHERLDGRLRRQGRDHPGRARPQRQDQRCQDGPGAGPRRRGGQGARQLRRLPQALPRARRQLPGRVGQLGQPGPPRGPEDGGLRGRRPPRRRPRLPPHADRQRRQPVRLLARLRAVRRGRPRHQDPGHACLPGRGRGPARARPPGRAPGDQGDRDPHRQPGLLAARRGRGRQVRWPFPCALRRPDPLRPGPAGPQRRRLRRARLGGRCRGTARRPRGGGHLRRGHHGHHRHRSRAQGHRHRPGVLR